MFTLDIRFRFAVQMCCLAEHTQPNMVFQEVLSATEMQVVRNDVSKLKNWPIQEAFLVSMKPQSSRSKFPWRFIMHGWMARTKERRMTWSHPISRMSQFVLCFTSSPWSAPKSCHQLQRMCHKSISRFKLWIYSMKHCPNIMWSNETGNFTQWGIVDPLSRACSGYTQSSTCW
jgi:hypothetical protein